MPVNLRLLSFRSNAEKFDKSFRLKMSVCSGVGYLFAAVPPVYIDPLLLHHVRYAARQYPNALYFIIPLGFLTFIITFVVMGLSQKILLNILPFIGALLLSVPIFRPEVPHGNLVLVGIIWIIIAILTFWAHNYKIKDEITQYLKPPYLTDKEAIIEYLKELTLFWRTAIIGLAGGYIALVISWVTLASNIDKSNVGGNESEAFILNVWSIIGILVCSIGLIICPLTEGAKKYFYVINLFLDVKETKHSQSRKVHRLGKHSKIIKKYNQNVNFILDLKETKYLSSRKRRRISDHSKR